MNRGYPDGMLHMFNHSRNQFLKREGCQVISIHVVIIASFHYVHSSTKIIWLWEPQCIHTLQHMHNTFPDLKLVCKTREIADWNTTVGYRVQHKVIIFWRIIWHMLLQIPMWNLCIDTLHQIALCSISYSDSSVVFRSIV